MTHISQDIILKMLSKYRMTLDKHFDFEYILNWDYLLMILCNFCLNHGIPIILDNA